MTRFICVITVKMVKFGLESGFFYNALEVSKTLVQSRIDNIVKN